MSLHRDILHVLRNNGMLTSISTEGLVQAGTHGLPSFGPSRQIGANFRAGTIAADRAQNRITYTMSNTEAASDNPAKCVEVCFEGDAVTTGAIDAPGCLFTGSLSGCVALLFRDMFGGLHMAHQYRDTTYRYDPTSEFEDRGATLLWKYASLGVSTTYPGCFGVALACAEGTDLYCFAFAGRGSRDGVHCDGLIHYDKIRTWTSAGTWAGTHAPV